MMKHHLLGTVALPVALLALGSGVLVWPNYRSAHASAEEIRALQEKIVSMPELTTALEEMTDAQAALRSHIANNLKEIPDQPDDASVVRKLSFDVDGYAVVESTFTKGAEIDAIQGVPTSEKSLPITFGLTADFDTIFALIRIAESMDRLVRVANVHIDSDVEKNEVARERGLLNATIVLEAIYDSGSVPGDESS